MTYYYPREITHQLKDALKTMPVVVISGMRQTGKTTLITRDPLFKKRRYITFDDLNAVEAAQRNPEMFLSSSQPVTIDEAHKVPEILPYLKRAVDAARKPGQFILSGSSNFLILKHIAESLAGRALYYTLFPFSRREIQRVRNKVPALVHFLDTGVFPEGEQDSITWREIVTGGMPSVCLGKGARQDLWFRGYEQTYIERDIRNLTTISDLISFRHLVQLAALRVGTILKQSELARDAKLNAMTTSRYLSLLEASFLIYRLPPYLNNRAKRLIKSPKIYFQDTGIAAYLTGIKNFETYESFRGALLENYVAQNLIALCNAYMPDATLSYWHVQGRYEVDFILEIGKETVAIEVKHSNRWQKKDLINLEIFMSMSNTCRAGILAYNGKELFHVDEKIWVVPVSLLLC